MLYNVLKSESNKVVLVEGVDSCMLDIDFGTYPYVINTSTTVGGVCMGLGIQTSRVGEVIAIVKAYSTRDSLGPFPSELLEHTHTSNIFHRASRCKYETCVYLQRVGQELNAVTCQKRRCGWLDLVLLKYTCMLNGFTQ
jgi:adenylosuccinate synthase